MNSGNCSSSTFGYWLVGFLARLYGRLFLRLKISFAEGSQERLYELIGDAPVIIAPNHLSYLDPPLICGAWPRPLHFFAGSHLFEKSKILSYILHRIHSHPVNRDHGVAALKEAIRLIQKERFSIALFPEGTRSQDGSLQELQDGVAFIALKSGAKIIPTYIDGTYEVWPKNAPWPTLFGNVSIHFGAPIDPKQVEEELPPKERIGFITTTLRDRLASMKPDSA